MTRRRSTPTDRPADVGADASTYSASEAASRSGLSRQGLLTWERRYSFPTPLRDERGYRRYTEQDLLDIARVRSAVARGTPVEAAIARLKASATPAVTETEALLYALLHAVLDSLPVQVAILRAPTYEFVYVNRALVRAVPMARVGTTIPDILEGRGSTVGLDRVLRTGEPWFERAEPLVVEGELKYFRASYHRLPALPGQPLHIMGIGYDVTEAERARRRIARSEDALQRATTGQIDPGLLRSVNEVAKAAESGFSTAVRTALQNLTDATDADSAALVQIQGDAICPMVSHYRTHGLRWSRLAIPEAGDLPMAIKGDRVRWLQASRVSSRSDQAMMSRLVARTLCVLPLTVPGRSPGAVLVRWSVEEHVPALAEFDLVDSIRRIIQLTTLATNAP